MVEPLSNLSKLYAVRDAYFEEWKRLVAEALGDGAQLSPDNLVGAFGRELERLGGPDRVLAQDHVEAALRATATCLAKRGVPLAEVLVATSLAERAAAGPLEAIDEATAATLVALERARMRAYSAAYLASGESQPRSCSVAEQGSLVQLGRRERTGHTYGMVGKSRAFRDTIAAIESAARGASSVLLAGDSGTGKELVARAVHVAAGGTPERFVAVNCAALPTALVESELFGHVRGAFTGSAQEYPGLFRAAEGGTLLLDEVTEMGPELQAKLLRALEDRAVRPVGSVREVPVNVRIVASTNRDIRAAIAAGRFRADLFYRLQAFTIQLPPLRDRLEDIPLLAEHFLSSFCHRRCGCILGVAREAMDVLQAWHWPGNVRELRNVIERAVTSGASAWIGVDDLPSEVRQTAGKPVLRAREIDAGSGRLPTLADAETDLVRRSLERFEGNKAHAARALGISRHKLYAMLARIEATGKSVP